jgi:hypothetical protein
MGGPAVEEQATIPGMESGPAPSGKVIDLSDVRAAGADKAKAAEPDKVEPPAPKADKQPDKPAPAADARAGKEMLKQARPPKADKAPPTDKGAKKAEQADKPRRGRPPKDQAAPEKKGKVARSTAGLGSNPNKYFCRPGGGAKKQVSIHLHCLPLTRIPGNPTKERRPRPSLRFLRFFRFFD